jgi:hypothetical protein
MPTQYSSNKKNDSSQSTIKGMRSAGANGIKLVDNRPKALIQQKSLASGQDGTIQLNKMSNAGHKVGSFAKYGVEGAIGGAKIGVSAGDYVPTAVGKVIGKAVGGLVGGAVGLV